MGQVDLHFEPTVPVFDANVALGRRHNRRVAVDTAEGTLRAMDRAGIDRALVYSPHAAAYDSRDGNALLLELIEAEPRLVPQFACNPAFDEVDTLRAAVADRGVRSVRMFPVLHRYPFRDWVVKQWLDWLARDQIPLWLPMNYDTNRAAESGDIDPSQMHDTLARHPDVPVVLTEVYYQIIGWILPFLRSLPNVYVEISKLVNTDGIAKLMDAVGDQRILYGSAFPDSAMAPQLYTLHRCGLSESSLRAICSGNLERLLGVQAA